ncbi:protein terminal ear1-like [Durio zibethinus]|uniref:Protein terminal ear1-like n=1 Tax=Durio zibethinus TaxID=66656 RepID=A0A6P5XD02_DURZI|nr:protein terminal ear1-like [Durio zibethinus]
MGESCPVQFPGNLDPSAQEFWPAKNTVCQPQIPLFGPLQFYYPYAAPPTVPFFDGGVSEFHTAVAVPASAPTAYVTTSMLVVPQPPLTLSTTAATRALVLTFVPCDVSESKVRKELEVFGEVRGVQMERIREGIVTVHFYDLRHAERALKEIREQHMQQTRVRNQYVAAATGCEPGQLNACSRLPTPARGLIAGRAVWAHFIIPASNALPDGNNQGTVVVFNLDTGVSPSKLKDIFQVYGPVKELRETPLKKHQKFVEFYDVRDAAKALREMNGKEINGKQVVIEFSRPGGYSKRFFNANNVNAFTACTDNISLTNKYNLQTRSAEVPSSPPLPLPPPQSLACKFSGRCSPNILPCSFLARSQSPTKKVCSSSKGNPNGNSNSKSSVAETSVVGEKVGGGGPKKTAKKNENNQSTVNSSNGSKQQLCKGRPWKVRQAKKFDTRFLISEDAMDESNCKDSRTTVMIKNIPNKYSQKLLLNMLDDHCIHCNEQIAAGDDQLLSSYDFVYLPIDFNNKCNVGYGFVNMTSPQATWRLYKAFHHQHWEVFNSRKICEVTYARVQGLEALKEHFRNSKFPCEMDHYLPVVFSPPRDGQQLTEPLAVVGQKQQFIISGPSAKATEEEDDDHSVYDGCNANLFDDGGVANSAQENNANDTNHLNYCDSDGTVDHQEEALRKGSCQRPNGGSVGHD